MVKNKKGITLVELLGAIAISSLAIALIASILTSFLIAINAIYSVGNANTQGMLISAEVLTTINNFAPDDVEVCPVEAGCDIRFIKHSEFQGSIIVDVDRKLSISQTIVDGNRILTYIETNGATVVNTRQVILRGYTYESIVITLDSTFDPIKTIDIAITIGDGSKSYDFIVSYLMTENPKIISP